MNETRQSVNVLGRVVVGVDGSVHALRAVRWAAEQAALERRELIVVVAGDSRTGLADEAVAAAQVIQPDLSVVGLAIPGDPRQVLIDLSTRAHLVVLGSRGRGTVRSMLLGSVSAAVSAHAICPVAVCRPMTDDEAQRGVVVGADATPESLPVIEFAYRLASLRGMPLTVLHSYWDAATAVARYHRAGGQRADAPDIEDLRAELSESVVGFGEKYPDVPVTLTLKHGLADQVISPRQGGWQMIVVGRHPMTSLARVLGNSIATAVVERANATVVVVPEGLGDA